MKIGFLVTRLVKYDAISNYTAATIEKLSVENKVDLYAFSIEREVSGNVGQYTYTGKNEHSLSSVLSAITKIYSLAKKFSKYDLLILCGPDIPPLLSAHLVKKMNPDIKLVWDYHGLTPPQFLNLKDRILTLFRRYAFIESMKRSDLILVRSEYIKEELRSAIGDKVRIRVVPLGIKLEQFKNINPSDIKGRYPLNGKFVLLYVGRLAPHKQVDFLMKSMKELEDAVLLIVGGGVEGKKLRSLAKSLNLNNLIFSGRVPDEDLPKYYAASDVFVTASLHEGFCVPIIESFASGKPAIVPNQTAIPEVAGSAGLVYEPDSMDDFVSKVKMLIDDSREQFSRNALERAKEFDIDKVLKKYENLLKVEMNTLL